MKVVRRGFLVSFLMLGGATIVPAGPAAGQVTQSVASVQLEDLSVPRDSLGAVRTNSRGETPQLYRAGVVFSASLAYVAGPRRPDAEFSIGTNLLGTLGSTIFEALGADGMRDYVLENISLGTSIPLARERRLSTDLGLGIGDIEAGTVRLWPVLNMVQADSSDARVPRSIVRGKAGQRGWTSRALTVAIAPRGYVDSLKAGKTRPIFSLGVRLPYYFPGDPFEAMAGIFTSKRSDIAKRGRCSWSLGVSIPLFAPKP